MLDRRSTASRLIDWILLHRADLLFLVLLIQVVAFCTQGIWVDDFWNHSAVVSELIRNPFNPTHPQLELEAPHAFVNPYTITVALFANMLGLDAVSALSVFGIFNFCLLAYGFRQFLSSLVAPERWDKSDTNQLIFYSALFVLFLWGGNPWQYSGFFNYKILFTNLPYPSTFVAGISLLALAYNARNQGRDQAYRLIILIFFTAVALLTHPLTAQFLLIGLAAQTTLPLGRHASGRRILGAMVSGSAKVVVIFVGALALASVWPFYPALDLLFGGGRVYDISNGDMYFHLYTRMWPFALLAPVYLWILLQPRHRPLLVIFLATAAIYVLGYLTHRYSFGRIISYCIFVLQIACAFAAIQFERWCRERKPQLVRGVQILILVSIASVAYGPTLAAVNRLMTVSNSILLGRVVSNQITYRDLLFIPEHTSSGAVVFADAKTSWILPSFNVKIVVSDLPLAFVADDEQRRQDVQSFFEPNTGWLIRQSLVQKYRAKYLLLSKRINSDWAQILKQFVDIERAVVEYEDQSYVLIRRTVAP
jgi:hypothetical protein